MAAFYDLVLAYFDRAPRPGITSEQIAAAGAAVVEGLVIKSALIPEQVNKTITLPGLDEEAEWHLASLAFLGIMEALTQPVSGDPTERAINALDR